MQFCKIFYNSIKPQSGWTAVIDFRFWCWYFNCDNVCVEELKTFKYLVETPESFSVNSILQTFQGRKTKAGRFGKNTTDPTCAFRCAEHFRHTLDWKQETSTLSQRWFFGLWTPSAAGSPAVGRFGKHLAPSGVQKASLARTHTCPIKSHWPDANSNEPESLPVSHGGSGVITPWRCFYSSRECSSAPDVTHGRLLTVVCDVLSGTMPTGG